MSGACLGFRGEKGASYEDGERQPATQDEQHGDGDRPLRCVPCRIHRYFYCMPPPGAEMPLRTGAYCGVLARMFAAAPEAGGRAIPENLRLVMQNYALATEQGYAEEQSGFTLISSGVAYSVFNAAILSEPHVGSPQELESRLAAAGEHYRARTMPWSAWLCDSLLSASAKPQTERVARRCGLRWIGTHAGMAASGIAAPRRKLPTLEYRRVGDAQTRRDFCRLSSRVFELPSDVATCIYDHERIWSGSLLSWTGYVNGYCVCMAATGTAAGAIGVYSVATAPEYRGRGYGEAITRHALAEARRASGVELTILHATRAGRPLYERMGYRVHSNVHVFVSV